jgi:hypothetical protein
MPNFKERCPTMEDEREMHLHLRSGDPPGCARFGHASALGARSKP